MKIAVCLYGQPRDYKEGIKNLSEFIKNNSQHSYDFFMHCWGDDNIVFECGIHNVNINNIDIFTVKDFSKIKSDLLEHYKPVAYEFEKPIHFTSLTNVRKSKMFKNTRPKFKNNFRNIVSQLYTRNKVRDILQNYIKDNNTYYDLVITTRYDYHDSIGSFFIDDNFDINKAHVSNFHKNSYVFGDNFIACPLNIYLEWFDCYNNIPKIVNNSVNEAKLKLLKINYEFIMEVYLLACFINFNDVDNIVYRDEIPR
jgi:hypothetical protein